MPSQPEKRRVALEELHRRITDSEIPSGAEVIFTPPVRQANGLPLEFAPGRRDRAPRDASAR